MQPYSLPEIEAADLKAAREFLTGGQDEERRARPVRFPQEPKQGVTVRNGITRARHRAVAKSGV
jgi:hypothetical protein